MVEVAESKVHTAIAQVTEAKARAGTVPLTLRRASPQDCIGLVPRSL